jgi:transposase
MRYELSDYEWTAIKPMLPNKPRGVRRVNDRRVLNGIFWVLRSGAPWRDLPETYGPRTTCYNRFVRWRRAGVWDQIMNALAAGHDAAVKMIDTSVALPLPGRVTRPCAHELEVNRMNAQIPKAPVHIANNFDALAPMKCEPKRNRPSSRRPRERTPDDRAASCSRLPQSNRP